MKKYTNMNRAMNIMQGMSATGEAPGTGLGRGTGMTFKEMKQRLDLLLKRRGASQPGWPDWRKGKAARAKCQARS
jgi:hypothetical protein